MTLLDTTTAVEEPGDGLDEPGDVAQEGVSMRAVPPWT